VDQRLLIIVPHLSTGGLPQVAVKRIEMLKKNYSIKVVEWSCIAWNFIVQKERIKDLIGSDNLITLGENKEEIFNIIDDFSPSIIFMEEFPEFFVPDEISERIYSGNRRYLIFECTHDSGFQPESKRWIPDKFVFVSAYTALRYASFDVPYELVEYPIDKRSKDRSAALSNLNLDPSYKHVVNVGLFTPRKNQSYVFEIAKILKHQKIMFHFIGNQADNFKWYWEPLLNNKPDNCVIWGERSDVDTFLQACDCFFFASEGKKGDKELNPIAIKEALEYDLPILMYNLDVYCGKYGDKNNFWFLTGDANTDSDTLLASIGEEKQINMEIKEVFDVSFNTENNRMDFYYHGENEFECSISVKDSLSNAPIYWFNWDLNCRGFYAIPIPKEHREFKNDPNFKGFVVDFYYKDSETVFFSKEIVVNPGCNASLVKLDFNPFDCYFVNYREFFVDGQFDNLPFSDLDLFVDIGANTGLFTKYLYSRGCKKSILIEADPRLRNNIVRLLGKDYEKSVIFMNPIFSEREDVDFWYSEKNTTIGKLGEPDYNNPNERELTKKISTRSIVFDDVLQKTNGKRISLLKCDIQGGEYPLFDSLSDDQIKMVDNYLIEFHSNTNGEINGILQKLEKNGYEYRITDWKDGKWEGFDETLEEGTIFASVAGVKKLEKPHDAIEPIIIESNRDLKIKLVHLQTTRNDEREIISREQLSQVSKYGIEYALHINEPYTSLPPSHNCYRPGSVSINKFIGDDSMGGGALTPGHYGCYESFRLGILSEFDKDLDFLIVCEGDCFIEVPMEEFVESVYRAARVCKSEKIDYFSFGDTNTLDMNNWRQSNVIKDLDEGFCFITDKIICAQSVMFNRDSRDFLFEKLRTHKWDVSDIYFNVIFLNPGRKMGIVSKRLTRQLDGYSLIDNEYKVYRKP